MRLGSAALALILALHFDAPAHIAAFAPSKSSFSLKHQDGRSILAVLAAPSEGTATVTEGSEEEDVLDLETISKLTFRELQRACKSRGLPATGNTATLRVQLRQLVARAVAANDKEEKKDLSNEELCELDIQFCDESDPDFDFKDLLSQVLEKSAVGHWKAATRKLKRLKRKFATPERPVPAEAYEEALRACVDSRLHGARAAEPARKIIEEMAEYGYEIPASLGNAAVQNCLGDGPDGTHDGCGGIDTALAMLAAMESSSAGSAMVTVETYSKVVNALTRSGAVDEALLLLRAMVVEHSFTPPLQTFADVAMAAAKDDDLAEKVLTVLAFAKAAGYKLDNIASTEEGRSILASGVIAAEKLDNLALGLRLLTAASNAEGCAPDRGDDLVASSSSAAQRASVLIHRRAIYKAVEDGSWKLAVKLLGLMYERSLKPAPSVLRSVVTCCAKAEKSRKATALLLDWVKLAKKGDTEKPPLSVFNTVVNACEICGEEELTLVVLDAMKTTHETEGNIITMNIALKRLAKLGNPQACEGLIIGMLQAGVEPSVVSYTTAIGACASDPKDPATAYEWLTRMRSRRVRPNLYTYNTALASCMDGKLESSVLASRIATEMLEDIDRELTEGIEGSKELKSVLPNSYTKFLARGLMQQLRDNWRNGEIDMRVAKATIRVPLLKLVDFSQSKAAEEARQRVEETAKKTAEMKKGDVEAESEATSVDELELEYTAVQRMSRTAEV